MPIKVLVVEDDPGIRHLIKMELARRKYNVELVEDAFFAKEYLEKTVPELVIMDIMMPGMSGIELAAWMRAQPSLKDVPVIQMSSLSDEVTLEDSVQAGVMDYIVKPMNFNVLDEKIKLALTRAQRRKDSNGNEL